jgi:MOSC domain-containing protein YiiM
MRVTNLFLKLRHGERLESVDQIHYGQDGLHQNVACAPFRQALIASRSVIAECGLQVGDLRENIVVDCDDLYDLPSGTIIEIGTARIRLTFHCEPCKQILRLIKFDQIEHRRGVFGSFLNSGTISVGDELVVTEERMESIPYATKERLRWYLQHNDAPSAALDLIHKIGLPAKYAKIMPRMLKRGEARVSQEN